VFLREYVDNSQGRPVSTGKFLSSPDGGLANWAEIKTQAATVLGLQLVDTDVTEIPMIKSDPYGKFEPGPARGLPQYVTTDPDNPFVEGDRVNPVAVPANAVRIGTAFLNDIAHSADPGSITSPKTADANSTAGRSLDQPASGEYDDELLDIHAICGDGRCNENIALQAVHQIFHNEHDRLVGDIKDVLTNDTSASGLLALPEWKAELGADGWNGERLFQAARFVTEMQYQHLVFEEFARKVQPAINPFQPFAFTQSDVNPAITAEFAHAVYRFGHSMLTDTIPRLNAPESVSAGAPLHNDIDLFDGFLNPGAYHDGGGGVTLTSAQAAGAILMGLSDQVGQEIDEFVSETLRNNLLGLPLDLPALNMTRARSEGVPPLNNVRRQIFAATNDGQLKPYTDWVDFGQQLKHPESLVNFVAAYGTHPTITGTLAERRAAAKLIVSPEIGEVQPFDAADFMFGTNHDETADNVPAVPEGPGPDGLMGTDCGTPTASPECADNTPAEPEGPGPDGILNAVDDPATNWANVNGRTVTGVDDIDLWIGGLAERTNLFGGLLGSTFNYVFENQLTNLQNGDRFYYLARTPGMNLRAQLEGNSFAELVMRNTDAHTLKADPFATADCKFELGNLTSPATSVGSSGLLITGTGSVQDDPASECDENEQLLRMADGTWRYRMTNTAMPSGINAQAVYNGKSGVFADRVWGGADNDTFWGGEGTDTIEGGDGADIALGGAGNDIITDLAGDDVPKGGPGNDAIDAGPGLDIIMGGDGSDFTNGGANINETFGGAGDDFAIAGQGEDAIFGDSGDDWEEGGDQPDLLIGDSSSFFFDDHNLPGHDILIGQGGDDDYDMEGGDDIGVAGPGLEKTAGAAGYDWQIGLADPQAQDMDLAQVFVVGGVILPGVRDKFNEVEALSGWNLDDTLRGDSVVPTAVGGGGFVGCDALDTAGVARIKDLETLVPAALRNVPAQPIIDASATHNCLLSGDVWGAGNILLGGGGSDLIEGRGADDIIDGDRYMNVRLSIRDTSGTEIGSTDLMENAAKSGDFGPGTADMTLQQAVFAGLVNPGNIVAVREILTATHGTENDVALYSGPRTDYEITLGTAGGEPVVTVAHTGGTAADGVDTLRNIETLRFSDREIAASSITAPEPAVALSATTLDFGAQDTAATATQVVTVSNTGSASLTVTGATLSGTDADQFAVTNGCTTVAPAGSCSITVAFTPTTTGVKSASLSIAHNAVGSPSIVALTGTGQTPVARPVMVIPETTDFGTRRIGTSRTQSIRVTNNGPGVLSITSVSATSPFTATRGNCPANLAVGRSCNLSATFTPTTVGPVAATLTVISNATVGTRVVALTGTGR
jgi:Ca2+-binding RTX toxin-like protein